MRYQNWSTTHYGNVSLTRQSHFMALRSTLLRGAQTPRYVSPFHRYISTQVQTTRLSPRNNIGMQCCVFHFILLDIDLLLYGMVVVLSRCFCLAILPNQKNSLHYTSQHNNRLLTDVDHVVHSFCGYYHWEWVSHLQCVQFSCHFGPKHGGHFVLLVRDSWTCYLRFLVP